MSGGLLQGLGQLPTLSHQRGFPSAPTLSSYCHPRRLQRRRGAFTSRLQQEVAFNMETPSGVLCSSEFRSAFRGNAAYLDQRRPKYMSKEMTALLSIRRPGQLLVVQGLNQPFVQSHRPRGTFPAFGEEPTRTSSIALQDSAGPKLNGEPGGFVSDQNLGGDRVPDQLISSEGLSRTFPDETMWRNERGIHLPTSSSQASPSYRQLPSRVKYSASGEEAVLRGFENAAQQPSNKHRSSLPYGKIGSGIEPSYMIPDYARSSQNGAHPPPINEKSRLSSTKQVYNGSVLRRAPSDRLRGSTSNNRRMRDTDPIHSRIRKFAPDAQARCVDRPSELGAQKQQNTLTLQTVKAFNHSAQAGAVSAGTKAGAAKWAALTEELAASKSPPAAGEKASLSPLHVTVELELVGGSVQDSHENLDAHGEQHVEFSEAVGENTSQLDVVFKSEAAHDPARQGVHAAEEFQDISEISTSSHKGRHGLNAKVLVVNNVQTAEAVVTKLRGEYRGLIHACDTEVAGIDVKRESPVGHGRLICFSIYCGPNADFGEDRCRLWVDVLSEPAVLGVFKSYFEDADINKVWHNYSFDKHVLANHGINARGFYADTMHLARLYDSARSVVQGGYSLEGLTSDKDIMRGYWDMISEEESGGKLSMKQLFGKANVKKNGEEGKLRVVPPVEELQIKPESRERWIQYSSFDTVCTWCLWKSLRDKLINKDWMIEGQFKQEGKKMYNFYEEYLKPFGNLLVQMEAEGMMLDREHLARIEEIAVKQQEFSANQFKRWAAKRCPDAIYMNVGSDAQIRQLLFGGKENRNESKKKLEMERVFSAPNTEEYVEDGKKTPKKTRPFTLTSLGVDVPVDSYTSGGWPAVGGAALKALAGKVAIDYTMLDEMSAGDDPSMVEDTAVVTSTGVKGGSEEDLSVYGKAYDAFGGGQDGKEACMAFAALCEVSSINTLISNFIQPLQGSDIKGPDGRVHCSLNINTETGRLSARRPSLQNQPALEKDRYKIRQAFIAAPGNSLIVADYGQLELRILAHLTDCKSMLKAFEDGGDFHSRTAMNMYSHVRSAVEKGDVLLEWDPKPGELKPPVPLLKDVFAAERRKAKMLNFSIAYGKTAVGLSKDWTVSPAEAKATVDRWYSDRQEVLHWQEQRMKEARDTHHVYTLLGRTRHFPDAKHKSTLVRRHIERAAINTPVQGSAADVAMCAMLEISQNKRLHDLGWKLLLQVHDEVILEGPTESADTAKDEVVKCMSYPFKGKNTLRVALAVDAKSAQSWYAAK